MTNREAIEYGKKWDEAIESRGDTPFSETRQFLSLAIKALEFVIQAIHGDCDYCKHKGNYSTDYPCCVCGDGEIFFEMWEEEDA